jgi:hypothetical protein
MRTKLKFLFVVPFFALLMFTSCQEEEIEVTTPDESEVLTETSELTSFIEAASSFDGSEDDIIDRASCISVKLPVIVKVRGIELRIDSRADFMKIRRLYDEFEDDVDRLDIIFPITITNADHEVVSISNVEALTRFIAECEGKDDEDTTIRCIDFQYPIAFSVFDANAEIINTVTVENDSILNRFMKRVRNAEVVASLNFPVTMVLADSTSLVAEDNTMLKRIISEARRTCAKANDFSKERLQRYLTRCPWIIKEFKRDNEDRTARFEAYALNFKNDSLVQMRGRNGDVLTGTWGLRPTRRGVLLKMQFDALADFTLEWLAYDFEDGKIKIHEVGGNRLIMDRNCEVIIENSRERIHEYLKTCLWRVDSISVSGVDKRRDYIGTPLKFLDDNKVSIRANGELIQGTYALGKRNEEFTLEIDLASRPDLKLQWVINFLREDRILLTNGNGMLVLKRHCPERDEDFEFITRVLTNGRWKVSTYIDQGANETSNYDGYTLAFNENGRVVAANDTNTYGGSWLAYRALGLNLGLNFRTQDEPFNELKHRWKLKEIAPERIELKDYNAAGEIERILVIEKENI